jgi:2-keto-4-pentenoate hydratase/2-oxohepta-3-ene-1,7-dioic acid hydratase in catechol pathway
MYLASFTYDGVDRLGVRVDDDYLVDLAEATEVGRHSAEFPCDMLELIKSGDAALDRIRSFLISQSERRIPITDVRFRPPVPKPGKICGVAMNNSASDERKISAPSHPMFFLKPSTCLIGHGEKIVVRSYFGGVHPEPELAVVIGKRARRLDPYEALDAVFGYTIFNDLTGNVMRGQDMVHYYALYASKNDPDTLERREQHLSYAARYKGTDGFGPIGPWLVTRDEVPDPGALDVTCTVGGEIIAEDSTRYLTYSVGEILAFLSRFQTLEPGDIVSMGTAFRPAKGSTRSLHMADLQRRDGPVTVSITGLGVLSNPVVRVAEDLGEWRLAKNP